MDGFLLYYKSKVTHTAKLRQKKRSCFYRLAHKQNSSIYILSCVQKHKNTERKKNALKDQILYSFIFYLKFVCILQLLFILYIIIKSSKHALKNQIIFNSIKKKIKENIEIITDFSPVYCKSCTELP
jgi:hypothetical protein